VYLVSLYLRKGGLSYLLGWQEVECHFDAMGDMKAIRLVIKIGERNLPNPHLPKLHLLLTGQKWHSYLIHENLCGGPRSPRLVYSQYRLLELDEREQPSISGRRLIP
jgi:hypothetical protein